MNGQQGNGERDSRIREVVDHCIDRRASGEAFPDERVVDEYPELMPELGKALRQLAIVEQAGQRFRNSAGDSSGWAAATSPPAESLPGYDLVGEIAHGGQGTVYQAIQQGTRRSVAIKVLKGDTCAASGRAARFDREVQILGRLNHPNILTIHDTGSAPGFSYYVTDYIHGVPLDEFVAASTPSVRETLELFIKICDAVGAAHLLGVIHRDLKPSNILVDENGNPQVLDFGLAKLVADDFIERTMTTTGEFVGSLPWASPEQIAGSPHEIDVRTDVYSIGVMLYQALTHRFPYVTTGNMREAIDNILSAEVAPPGEFRKGIDHDVDTIVLKCLAKTRVRRYQTAGELARDLRHYLAGEPIDARRDSVGYVLAKHLRRHKLPLAIVTGFILTMTIGFVTSLTFWRRAADERDAAETARTAESEQRALAEDHAEEAEIEAAKARAVVDFLVDDLLAAADPRHTPNRDLTVKEVLDQAAESIEGRFRNEPLIEATIRATLGRTYLQLGEYDLAEEQLVAALMLRRAELDQEHPQVLGSMSDLAELHRLQSRYEEAEPLLTDALAASRRVLGDQHLDTLQRINDLALLYRDLGRYADAERLMTEALAGLRRLNGPENADTLGAMTNLAKVYRSLGRWNESEALYLEALAATRRLMGDDHPLTLAALTSLAVLYSHQDRHGEAEPLLVEAVELYRNTLGGEHPYTLTATHQLAEVYRSLHRFDQAASLLGETLAAQRALLGEDHHDTLTTLSTLGLTLVDTGRHAEAEPLLVEALERKRRTLGGEHPSTLMAMHQLGFLHRNQGRHAEAEALFAELLPARRRLLGDSHPHTIAAMGFLCVARAKLGRFTEAEPLARQLVTHFKSPEQPAQPTMIARAQHLLADILVKQGKPEEAEPALREALELRQSLLPDDDALIAITQSALGECLASLGRYDEAEPLLLESYSRLAPRGDEPGVEARRTSGHLITLYEAWGKPERAAEWRSRAGDVP